MLPEALRRAIEAAAGHVAVARLRAAAAALSSHYRHGGRSVDSPRATPRSAASGNAPGRAMVDADRRMAYLVTRLPATTTALGAALARLRTALPEFVPASLLDLGAGPGAGLWAADAAYPGAIAHATLVDDDAEMVSIGVELWRTAHGGGTGADPDAGGIEAGERRTRITRVDGDLLARRGQSGPALASGGFEPHDLVLCSYVLGELAGEDAVTVLERAWAATRTALVVVEPGWPRGHARLMSWRDRLLAWGAHVVAPCPHDLGCPLVGSDWCHFAARLERSRLHRLVKGGALGWEDEKYAYLVATRVPAARPPARIIHPPRIEKGHVGLRLCREGRADDVVVSRREGGAYKAARKAAWGDGWPPPGGNILGIRGS